MKLRAAWWWLMSACRVLVPVKDWARKRVRRRGPGSRGGFRFAKYRVAPRLGAEVVRQRLSRKVQSALLQLRPRDSSL